MVSMYLVSSTSEGIRSETYLSVKEVAIVPNANSRLTKISMLRRDGCASNEREGQRHINTTARGRNAENSDESEILEVKAGATNLMDTYLYNRTGNATKDNEAKPRMQSILKICQSRRK